jgi:hypothetical protein
MMAIIIDDEYIEDKVDVYNVVDAYNVAIEALKLYESDSDTAGSRAMRLKLARKLASELDRWLRNTPRKE